MKEYDMSQILKVLNEAHTKLMELTVPKKKVRKREEALRELRRRINSGSFLCGYHPAIASIVQRVIVDITREINEMLLEDEQNNK